MNSCSQPPLACFSFGFLSFLSQVDCALSLVRLGKEREIPGLERLCDDLVTMETLVYETSCELGLTLKDFQQLSDIDKLHLLMKNVRDLIFHLLNCTLGKVDPHHRNGYTFSCTKSCMHSRSGN